MIAALAALCTLIAQPELPEGFIVMAHRGVVTEEITENSMQSLEAAIERGYTHMEVDLRCTKDGVAVCLHDSSLKRTTGVDANIYETTLEELYKLVDKDTVPTFAEFAKRAEGRIDLQPDIKQGPRDLIKPFAKSLNESMKKHGLMDNAYFIGDRRVMVEMDITGRVSISPKGVAEGGLEEGPDARFKRFVFGHGEDFNEENLAEFRKMGLPVIVSINTFHYREGDPIAQGIAHVKEMIDLKVDGIQIDSVYDEPVFGPIK